MKYLAFIMDVGLLKAHAWKRMINLFWVDFPLKPCMMGAAKT